MASTRMEPSAVRSMEGSWCKPNSRHTSAEPGSSPNTIISTPGWRSVQLLSALRWAMAMSSRKGLAVVKMVSMEGALSGSGGQEEVPAGAFFEGVEHGGGHPGEVGFADVAVLDVVGDAVGEDVVEGDSRDFEAVAFQKGFAGAARVGVGDGAAGLRFGAFGH